MNHRRELEPGCGGGRRLASSRRSSRRRRCRRKHARRPPTELGEGRRGPPRRCREGSSRLDPGDRRPRRPRGTRRERKWPRGGTSRVCLRRGRGWEAATRDRADDYGEARHPPIISAYLLAVASGWVRRSRSKSSTERQRVSKSQPRTLNPSGRGARPSRERSSTAGSASGVSTATATAAGVRRHRRWLAGRQLQVDGVGAQLDRPGGEVVVEAQRAEGGDSARDRRPHLPRRRSPARPGRRRRAPG